MRLTPMPGNDMSEVGGKLRDGFIIHGDSRSHPGEASIGCPVLGPRERDDIGKSGIRYLEVLP
jgi:hypothetical protein